MHAPLKKNHTNDSVLQILRFGVTGVLATAVHVSIFLTLLEVDLVSPAIASGIGFIIAFGLSFTLQKLWTFADTDRAAAPKQLGLFMSLQLSMVAFNVLGVYVLVEQLELVPLYSQLAIVAMAAVVTFCVSKFFIFTKREVPNHSNETVV